MGKTKPPKTLSSGRRISSKGNNPEAKNIADKTTEGIRIPISPVLANKKVHPSQGRIRRLENF